MKTVEIKCDACGCDLTVRTNSMDYRLVLAAESKPGYGSGTYTDMMIWPPVDRAYHFCDLTCLDKWRDRERHKNKLRANWLDEWKKEHGTWENGRCRSYPSPPDEGRAEREAEYQAAALAAFP